MRDLGLLVTHAYWPHETSVRDEPFAPHQVARLTEALARHGLRLCPVFWEDAGEAWNRFVAVLPLMAWGYPQNPVRFAAALAEIEAAGVPLLNSLAVIAANRDKGYLVELSLAGAPVPATIAIDAATPEAIRAAMAELGCAEAVVKPRVGAGAWRQARVRVDSPLPPAEELPAGHALVQPFLPAVASEGEMSVLVFGGVASHALRKMPKPGDYRTQGHHGATETPAPLTDDLRQAVGQVLAMADPAGDLAYARVDFVRGPDGGWLLMELELIEPFLYLAQDGTDGVHGARLFAEAVAARLPAA